MKWFRLYSEILDDPKVFHLSDLAFRLMIMLFALNSEQNSDDIKDDEEPGYLDMSDDDIVWRIRWDMDSFNTAIKELISSKVSILKKYKKGYLIVKWKYRQFESDNSYKRVKRYRERYSNVSGNVSGNVSSNVSSNVSETANETTMKRYCNGPDKIREDKIREEDIPPTPISDKAEPKNDFTKAIDPEILDLSFKFHQTIKNSGKYHKDFDTLSNESKVVTDGAKTITQLMNIEKEKLETIRAVLRFAVTDSFWKDNLVSLSSLRQKSKDGNIKYFTIKNQMNKRQPASYQQQNNNPDGPLPLPHGFWQKKTLNGKEVIFCTEMVMANGREWREYVFPDDPGKLHKITLEEYEAL